MKSMFTYLAFALSSFVAATAQAQWGAIAVDDNTMNTGYRVGAATAEQAQNDAMYWCRRSNPNCHLLWTFDHACGTYAASQNHRNWWTVHNEGSNARQVADSIADAVASCRDAGGERCAPQVSMCSSDQNAYAFPNQAAVSAAVIGFATARVGQQVGNGQCWSLVDAALAAAGAVRPGQRNFDTYVFGMEVYSGFRAGDILQFENVRLESPGRWSEFPHHTAIVAAANGNVLTIYQQNANGNMHVTSETIDIGTKVRGLIRAYRPIPQG